MTQSSNIQNNNGLPNFHQQKNLNAQQSENFEVHETVKGREVYDFQQNEIQDIQDSAAITKEEEERLSMEYINKLSKKEAIQDYFVYENNSDNYIDKSDEEYQQDNSSDRDYKDARKKKHKVNKNKKTKPLSSKTCPSVDPSSDRKQKQFGEVDKDGFRSGAYTPEEEKKFLEGLDLFGRQWKTIASHVGTRNIGSIKSKAQSYFIKLYKHQKPLPDKVRETGEGYTLSGQPLDPESASAMKYLNSGAYNKKTEKDANKDDLNNDKYLQPIIKDELDSTKLQDLNFGPREKSIYSIEKLRNNPKKIKNAEFNDKSYAQLENSEKTAQPFDITVSNIVLGLMDLHSHMSEQIEVIGLLGGSFNKDKKILEISTCYPARSTSQNVDSHYSVELDPVSEVEIRNSAANEGLKIIGWYHSHPKFKPNPSVVDLEYQLRYQKLATGNQTESTPFIGCIISTYSHHLRDSQSEINWFYFNNFKSAYEMDSEELYRNAKQLDVMICYQEKTKKLMFDRWLDSIKLFKEKNAEVLADFSLTFRVDNIKYTQKILESVTKHIQNIFSENKDKTKQSTLNETDNIANYTDTDNTFYTQAEVIDRMMDLVYIKT